jgi:hypothetical protein
MINNLKTPKEIDAYIYADMQNKWDWLKNNHPELDVIFMIAKGSMNYDMMVFTENYQSDVDVEVIICPTLDQIIRGDDMISTTYVMKDNSHVTVRDIRIFKDLLFKQNLAFLELLHSKYFLVDGNNEKELLKELQDLSNEIDKIDQVRFFKTLKGMILEKQAALTHPYPNQKEEIEKYGYARKQIHHIERLYLMMFKMIYNNTLYKDVLILDKELRDRLLDLKINHYDKNEIIWASEYECRKANELINLHLKKNKDNFKVNEITKSKVENIIYVYIKINIYTKIIKEIKGGCD